MSPDVKDLPIEEYEKLDPVATIDLPQGKIVFSVPNKLSLNRVMTLPTKEPDTFAWIESFAREDVFLDIGANVGIYTILAAMTRGVHVYAFEPESQNFAVLNKNIFLNQLDDRVRAFPIALSDEATIGDLYLSNFVIGDSCHSFGEMVDFKHEKFTPNFTQGCVSVTLDELVATKVIAMPQHIKIDVDGIEHKVLAGARRVLADERVKTVLVELNTNLEVHRDEIAKMRDLGYSLSEDQVSAAIRNEGIFKGVGNHIFRR